MATTPMATTPTTNAATAAATNSGAQSAINDVVANGNDTMAITKTLGELNKNIGFTTAIASTGEAMGTTAKNRADAMKNMV